MGVEKMTEPAKVCTEIRFERSDGVMESGKEDEVRKMPAARDVVFRQRLRSGAFDKGYSAYGLANISLGILLRSISTHLPYMTKQVFRSPYCAMSRFYYDSVPSSYR